MNPFHAPIKQFLASTAPPVSSSALLRARKVCPGRDQYQCSSDDYPRWLASSREVCHFRSSSSTYSSSTKSTNLVSRKPWLTFATTSLGCILCPQSPRQPTS